MQKILEKQNLWSIKRLKLECSKPKYFYCQVVANYKIYIKGHKYNLCKTPKQYRGTTTFTKNQKYNAYTLREEKC